MQESYSSRYRELWSNHWWWRARHLSVMSALKTVCDSDGQSADGRVLLDIGCAGGVAFDEFSRFGQMRGIEPDQQLLDAESPWTAAIDVVMFDASYSSESPCNVILMLDVLEHIEDDAAALSKALELLTPNGSLILTVPALPSLWSAHDEANHHFRRYTRDVLLTRLRDAGFEVASCDYAFGWSLPLLYARRLVTRRGASDYSVSVPSRIINSMFYSLTRMEQVVCRAFHISPMAGSSLFVIARRPAGDSCDQSASELVETTRNQGQPQNVQTAVAS